MSPTRRSAKQEKKAAREREVQAAAPSQDTASPAVAPGAAPAPAAPTTASTAVAPEEAAVSAQDAALSAAAASAAAPHTLKEHLRQATGRFEFINLDDEKADDGAAGADGIEEVPSPSDGLEGGKVSGRNARRGEDRGRNGSGRRRASGQSGPASADRRPLQNRGDAAQAPRQKRRRRLTPGRIAGTVVALLLIIAVALGGFVVWTGWVSHNDKADMAGSWVVDGTDAVITITDDAIVLTDEVAYRYTLDENAKTLAFTFGNLDGGGRYRFSLDRNRLAIEDGEFTFAQTAPGTFWWTVKALLDQAAGTQTPLFDAAGKVITLTRMPEAGQDPALLPPEGDGVQDAAEYFGNESGALQEAVQDTVAAEGDEGQSGQGDAASSAEDGGASLEAIDDGAAEDGEDA